MMADEVKATLPSRHAIYAACAARDPHLMIRAELVRTIPHGDELIDEMLVVAFAAGMAHAGVEVGE